MKSHCRTIKEHSPEYCSGKFGYFEKVRTKKEQNTDDMLAYMASRKEQAKTVPDTCLNALSDQKKIDAAKLSEIAAVMGIVIDKFVNSPADNRMKEKRLEIELLKLESRINDSAP